MVFGNIRQLYYKSPAPLNFGEGIVIEIVIFITTVRGRQGRFLRFGLSLT